MYTIAPADYSQNGLETEKEKKNWKKQHHFLLIRVWIVYTDKDAIVQTLAQDTKSQIHYGRSSTFFL